MEEVRLTYGSQKVCPNCSIINQQRRIETIYYIEYQMWCHSCKFFERFRVPKVAYATIAPVGMASAFYEPIQAELQRMGEELKAKEQEAWANLEGIAC